MATPLELVVQGDADRDTNSPDLDAAEVYQTLLDQPLFHSPDAGRYVQLMAGAGRIDEAVAVLERYAADNGPFAGDLLLELASAYAARDDLDAYRQAIARVRAHWSAVLPQVSVRADGMEASLAAAEGDNERAAQLFRSLTDRRGAGLVQPRPGPTTLGPDRRGARVRAGHAPRGHPVRRSRRRRAGQARRTAR